MTSIEIDLDVYKAIVHHSQYIDEPANNVLKRLLKLNDGMQASSYSNTAKKGGISVKNVFLSNGMKLRKHYKGKLHEAFVVDGYIDLNNKKFTSPSGAAVYVTKGPVNGWRFWEYFDESDGKWKILETLRDKS